MKRCPECSFVYRDDQERCDWCGNRLAFTASLPPLAEVLTSAATPTPLPEASEDTADLPPLPEIPSDTAVPPLTQAPPKSVRPRWQILVVGLLVLGTVLVISYPRIPRAVKSSSAAPTGTPSRAMPVTNPGAFPTPVPPQSAESNAAQSTDGSPDARDPFVAPSKVAEPEKEKSNPSSSPAAQKGSTPAPGNHNQTAPDWPILNESNTVVRPSANETVPTQKTTATSNSRSQQPVPTAKPKPSPQTKEKDSKVKSLLKKAGNVLKKPFEN